MDYTPLHVSCDFSLAGMDAAVQQMGYTPPKVTLYVGRAILQVAVDELAAAWITKVPTTAIPNVQFEATLGPYEWVLEIEGYPRVGSVI